MPTDDREAIDRLIQALRPWLGHLVIVGGLAHQLHRIHPLATVPVYLPIRTRDADLAFALDAPLHGDISDALSVAGFEEDLTGEQTPPVAQYRLGGKDEGFYAEFLAPLRGSDYKRGRHDATVTKAGITAQKLRHLELLLTMPWTVEVDVNGPLAVTASVMITNPVSFIVQKLLIYKSRDPNKRSQDVLYIHDTLELFGSELEVLRDLWRDHIRPSLAPKVASDVVRLYREQFGRVTDVIRGAARIPGDRALTPDNLRAACAYGLGELFDAS